MSHDLGIPFCSQSCPQIATKCADRKLWYRTLGLWMERKAITAGRKEPQLFTLYQARKRGGTKESA